MKIFSPLSKNASVRRMFVVMLLIAQIPLFANAQTGTWGPGAGPQLPMVQWGQRLPYLYYYGSNWYDYYWTTYNVTMFDRDALDSHIQIPAYIGRPCITDSLLKVVGIAAPLWIGKTGSSSVVDTSMAGRLPEYFRLYQQEEGDYILKAQTRWDTTTPKHWMELASSQGMDTAVLYEAYFEKPVIVHDTFYVGGTTWNNIHYGNNSDGIPYWAFSRLPTNYVAYFQMYEYSFGPNPNGFLFKFLWPWTVEHNLPSTPPISDTTVFTFKTFGLGPEAKMWWCFFAIFDTNYISGQGSYNDSCPIPTGLHLETLNESSIILAWNAGNDTLWELSVTKQGTSTSSGLMIQTPINYITIDSLEWGNWYVAKVRTLCDTDLFGPWSSPISFYVGNPDDTVNCFPPNGLMVNSTSAGKVVLSWTENAEAVNWQVEVGSADTPVGEGTVTTAPMPVTERSGLDTATWHWARVRSKCGTDWYSLWTDTVMFYIPSDTTDGPDNPDNPNDTTQAINLVEQYTYLMPNPARDEVTVASSFRVKAVELYAADGKLLQQVEVNAVGTTLSLEGLPAGIYFVRVRTSAGVTTKRLVVE